MTAGDKGNFAKKHQPGEIPDKAIRSEIENKTKNRELPCAVAFKIANKLQVSVEAVGMNVDLLNFKLTKCQLGLFGYYPQKKVIKPKEGISRDLKNAIAVALDQGRLPCKSAWDISLQFEVGKMEISGACEAMGIKIKNCQLGAF